MLRDSNVVSFVLTDISQQGDSTKCPRTIKLSGLYFLEVSLWYYQVSHRKLGEQKGSHWVIPKDCIDHDVLRCSDLGPLSIYDYIRYADNV